MARETMQNWIRCKLWSRWILLGQGSRSAMFKSEDQQIDYYVSREELGLKMSSY